LDEIDEVSIFGPYDLEDANIVFWDLPIDTDVLMYFQRRFRTINRFTKEGYKKLEK